MAHPLNRPRFDADAGRVVEGYAVLQPRVTPSLPIGREGSLFQRVFSSMGGIDPYAAAVSDVYQDLFGEGSYAGKGIYDVDAFEAALQGRVPDSTLLSHDLFEGVFARAGLATDIEVIEEFPAGYDVAALRQHRWARGDWQLLPWIFGRGPIRGARIGSAAPSRRSAAGRCWTTCGARCRRRPRSLALLAGWPLPSRRPLIWTAFVLRPSRCRPSCRCSPTSCRGALGVTLRSYSARSAPIAPAAALSALIDRVRGAPGLR